MTSNPPTMSAPHQWIDVDATCVPAPPRGRSLQVHSLTPDQFVVTYDGAAGCLTAIGLGQFAFVFTVFGMIITWKLAGGLTDPREFLAALVIEGTAAFGLSYVLVGRLRQSLYPTEFIALTPRRLAFGRLTERPEQPRSRLELDVPPGGRIVQTRTDRHDGDHVTDALMLRDVPTEFTFGEEFSRAETQWYARRASEWLGWTFPEYCPQCGAPLRSTKISADTRQVTCDACEWQSPVPDAGVAAADRDAFTPPPELCPECAQTLAAAAVNRNSGGYRCQRCGYRSDDLDNADRPVRSATWNDLPRIFRDYLLTRTRHPGVLVNGAEVDRRFTSLFDAEQNLEDGGVELGREGDSLRVHYRVSLIDRLLWPVVACWFVCGIGGLLAVWPAGRGLVEQSGVSFVRVLAVLVCIAASIIGWTSLLWYVLRSVTLEVGAGAIEWRHFRRKHFVRLMALRDVRLLNLSGISLLCLQHGEYVRPILMPSRDGGIAIYHCLRQHFDELSSWPGPFGDRPGAPAFSAFRLPRFEARDNQS